MKQKNFLDFLFCFDEKGEIYINFNSKKIDRKEIEQARDCIIDFLKNTTEKEIYDYNKEVDNYWKNETKKYNEEIIEKKKDCEGYIYVIKSLELYKIGKTKNKESRLKKYNTENPHSVELILCEKVDKYSETEENLHKLFKKKRKVGEWFKLNVDDILQIKNYINEI